MKHMGYRLPGFRSNHDSIAPQNTPILYRQFCPPLFIGLRPHISSLQVSTDFGQPCDTQVRTLDNTGSFPVSALICLTMTGDVFSISNVSAISPGISSREPVSLHLHCCVLVPIDTEESSCIQLVSVPIVESCWMPLDRPTPTAVYMVCPDGKSSAKYVLAEFANAEYNFQTYLVQLRVFPLGPI